MFLSFQNLIIRIEPMQGDVELENRQNLHGRS